MFGALARIVTRHPWRVITAWLVGAAIILALSPQLVTFTSNDNASFLPASYASVQAQAAANRYFPSISGASGVIVVSATNGSELAPADQSKIGGLVQSLNDARIPAVNSVATSPLALSANKKVQLIQVTFAGQPGQKGPNAAVAEVRTKTDALLAGTGLSGGLTGNAAISVDSTKAFDDAEKVIAIATVLLILLLLGIVFRSVLISVLPIVVIGLIHQMAQAVTADLADWFHFVVGPELAPLLVVVMFGVGTDYMVFLLFRYRERIVAGDEPIDALRFAVERVGEVITSAGATVMAAFAALLVATLESLKTLAPGLIVGIALMLVAALTLVPAIFTVLGRHLFWPTQPAARVSARRTRSELIADLVAKRPAVVLSVWSVVLIILALGILGYRTTYNQLAELPQTIPSQIAYNKMASAFPAGALGPTQVFVVSETGAPLDPSDVTNLGAKLSKVHGVSDVLPAQYSATKQEAEISVLLTDDPYSTAAMNLVTGPISNTASTHTIAGAQVLVGGTTAQLADVRTALGIDMQHVFPLALIIVGVILGLLLRAVVAPLYLLLGIVLTYVATLGVITFIFVNGLGFVGLDFTIPIVAYLFVMAIGTDYNILIAARLREGFDSGLAPREASRQAVLHGAPAVTSAALILAGTFASLILTGIQLLEEIGLAVALGVLLAANVLATRIVPTLAALRGWRFWWPHKRHLRTAAHREELLAGPSDDSGDGAPATGLVTSSKSGPGPSP